MQKIFLFAAWALALSCGQPRNATGGQEGEAGIKESLTTIRWELTMLGEKKIPDLKRPIYILFKENNTVEGFGGCNGFSGVYEIADKQVKIGSVMSTKMWCSEGETEQQFFAALQQMNGVQRSGEELKMLQDDKAVARFKAVYVK